MAPPLCGTPRRRSAPAQSDPALAESRGTGRRERRRPSEKGTPQGGSISVLLSNVYLHYVLDLWFERVVKPRLHGEAYLMRYIDDFRRLLPIPGGRTTLCSRYWSSAWRSSPLRLSRPKPSLVEFGRFAERTPSGTGKRPETFYVSGLYPVLHTQPPRATSRWDWKTEKSRLRRSLAQFHQLLQIIRHEPFERPSRADQPSPARPLCLLRHSGQRGKPRKGLPPRRTLLA